MVRITIDNELRNKLLAAEGVVELCDAEGRILIRTVAPGVDPLEGWEPLGAPVDEEEIQRRLASEEPGLTTEELVSRLRQLP